MDRGRASNTETSLQQGKHRVGFVGGDIAVERVMVVLIATELDRANSPLSALNEMTCLHMEPRRTGRR